MVMGFTRGENPNEFTKNDWTIRTDGSKVEVFNNPDKGIGRYFITPVNKLDIEQLVLDIEEFDRMN